VLELLLIPIRRFNPAIECDKMFEYNPILTNLIKVDLRRKKVSSTINEKTVF